MQKESANESACNLIRAENKPNEHVRIICVRVQH